MGDLRGGCFAACLLVVAPSLSFAQGHGHGHLTVDDAFVQASHDKVPRFCNLPTAGTPIVESVRSGAWSDAAVWSNGVVPGHDARIKIVSGDTVTYDVASDTRIDCIEIEDGAHLTFATDRSTRLLAHVVMLLPGGALTIGSAADPIADDVTAEMVFRGDTPLATGTVASPGVDPAQYGRGLVGFGTVRVHGRPMDRTFLRLAQEPRAGDSTLELEAAPVGWRRGDTLIVPDTRQIPFTKNRTYVSEAEEVEIASVDGSTVVLTAPLAYDHKGPRDAFGNAGPTEQSMLPHVGNLTRNVSFRSEDPSTNDQRGHVQFFHRADLDIRFAAFVDLGRTTIADLDNTTFSGDGLPTRIGTNQVGRYSLHFHHVWGPENPTDTGYQLHAIGNALVGMNKWGMTVHDTHYGLFRDNVFYDGRGSALATEDGNEAFNVFERNFVVHTKAGDEEQILQSPGWGGVFNTRARFGTTRDAFWFSGEYNYVRDNVAANVPDFAYNYNGYYLSQTMRVPRFRGANILDPAEYEGWNYRGSGAAFVEGRDRREGLPVLESARNEAYGATGQGLWLTWARGCCSVGYYKQVSLFEDYRLWHVNHSGVYAYHESRNTYDGFVLRADVNVSRMNGNNARFNHGFFFGTSAYENGQLVVSDFDVQGFNVGIAMPPNLQDGTSEPNVSLLRDGVLKNHINLREFFTSGAEDKTALLDSVHFTPVDTYESNRLPPDPINLEMSPSTHQTMRPMRPSEMFVHDWNGEEGDSFQLYWVEQAPGAVVLPPARPDLHGGDPEVSCPVQGLTNQECQDQFGVALAGAVAPCAQVDGDDCSAARARAASRGIVGLHFPIGVTPPSPTPAPTVTPPATPVATPSPAATPSPDGTPSPTPVPPTPEPTTTPPCAPAPEPVCGVPDRAVIAIRDRRPDMRDIFNWEWVAAGGAGAFGDPVGGDTSFTLCLYDQQGASWNVATSLHVPAGGRCGGRDCWKVRRGRGFHYRDDDRIAAGVRSLRLDRRPDGKVRVVLKASGPDVPLPVLPLAQDATVVAQLRSSDGACWRSEHARPTRRNDTGAFRDNAR